MPGIPLLHFYDTVVVPIGEKDRNALNESVRESTQWLIGLVWNEEAGISGWRVMVYPTCEKNPFWHRSPFYKTEELYSFDIALKISTFLEKLARKDSLTTRQISQEIKVHSYF